MVSFSVDSILHLAAPPSAAPPAKNGPLQGPSFSDHLDQAEQAPRPAPNAKRSDEPDDPPPSQPAETSPADADAEQNAADGTEQAEGHGEPRGDAAPADEDSTPQEEPRDELELSGDPESGNQPPFEIAVDRPERTAEAEPADQEPVQAEASAGAKPAKQLDAPASEEDPEADTPSKRPIAADTPDNVAGADQNTVPNGAARLADDARDDAQVDAQDDARDDAQDGARDGAANGPKTAARSQPQPPSDATRPEQPEQKRDATRPDPVRNRDTGPHPHVTEGSPLVDVPSREDVPRRDGTRLRVEAPRVESAESGRGTEPPANSETHLRITAGRLAGSAGHSEGAKTRSVDQVRFVQRVARAFHAARNGPGEIRLRLHPPELGHLRLEVRMEDGTLQARMETETATAKSVLLDNLPALRERLAQQDIRLDRVNVDVMQHSDGGSGQRAAEDARRDRQQMAPGRAPRDDEAADVVAEDTGLMDYDNGNLNVVI